MPRARRFARAAPAVALVAAVSLVAALPPERERWVRVRTEHFELVGNAGAGRVEELGQRLERLREVLASTWPGLRINSPMPTRIFVFRDDESFGPYKPRRDGTPRNLSGLFAPTWDGNYVALDASAAQRPFEVIQHEYLHDVLQNTVPAVPLWLNEGLAEFFSTFEVRGRFAEVGRPPEAHLPWLRAHAPLPLERLFAVDSDDVEYHEAERSGTFYAQSWALVHWMLAPAGDRRGRLGRMLARIESGVPAREAFEAAFGLTLDEANAALAAYLAADSYSFYRSTFDARIAGGTSAREPLGRAETLFLLGDLLAHLQPIQVDAAERHLRAALELQPDHADALVSLGFVREHAGDHDGAERLFVRAGEVDAANARAPSLLGRSRLARFLEAVHGEVRPLATTPPALLEARAAFRRALDLTPSHPPTLAGYGRTFLFDRERVEEGRSALAAAWAAMPGDLEILAEFIVVTSNAGHDDDAWRLLDEVLRPRGDAELVLVAESALAQNAAIRAVDAFNADRPDDAEQLIGAALGRVRIPSIRAQLDAQRASLQATSAANRDIAAYNAAVRAAEHGDLADAVDRLAEIVASDPADAALAETAREHLGALRSIVERNAVLQRIDRAAGLMRDGELTAARLELEALLAGSPPADAAASARALLRQLR